MGALHGIGCQTRQKIPWFEEFQPGGVSTISPDHQEVNTSSGMRSRSHEPRAEVKIFPKVTGTGHISSTCGPEKKRGNFSLSFPSYNGE